MVAVVFASTMVNPPGAAENRTYCSCPRAHARCANRREAATEITTKAATRAARIERKDGSMFYLKRMDWFYGAAWARDRSTAFHSTAIGWVADQSPQTEQATGTPWTPTGGTAHNFSRRAAVSSAIEVSSERGRMASADVQRPVTHAAAAHFKNLRVHALRIRCRVCHPSRKCN